MKQNPKSIDGLFECLWHTSIRKEGTSFIKGTKEYERCYNCKGYNIHCKSYEAF